MNKIKLTKFFSLIIAILGVSIISFLIIKSVLQNIKNEHEGNIPSDTQSYFDIPDGYNIKQKGFYANSYIIITYDTKLGKYFVYIQVYLPGHTYEETKKYVETEVLPKFKELDNIRPENIEFIDYHEKYTEEFYQ